MNDTAHKTMVSELAGAYWTSVHTIGFNFQAVVGTNTPTRSDSEAVISRNNERAGMLMSHFIGTTDL